MPDPALQRRLAELEGDYRKRTARLEELYRDAVQDQVGLTISDGREIRIPLAQVIGISRPNDMGWVEKPSPMSAISGDFFRESLVINTAKVGFSLRSSEQFFSSS